MITKRYSAYEAPKVSEEELLSALADHHKGKVRFIDFWATWYGGCRRTIKEYEPIKKELGENIAFVYLTGPSSIEKTWKILIQDVIGEHYWLSERQQGYLWKHFQMKGLLMCLVIDEQGDIVKRLTHVTRKELEESLKQGINKQNTSIFKRCTGKRVYRSPYKLKIIFATDSRGEDEFVKRGVLTCLLTLILFCYILDSLTSLSSLRRTRRQAQNSRTR